ncbi:hypothetical protein METP2_00525 [Methanosarcinales archaeon]|nr:hypothetical protein [Candidatus Methanoperedens sp.]CAG0956467.1 hypothetical protein METP2_00525 [Methanosarcinales archaeon]
MRRDEIFYYAQKTGKIRFEGQLRTDFKYPQDFDELKFNNIIKRIGITQTGEKEDIIHNLGMGQVNGKFVINNGGILFFGKNRELYLRQAYITCVLYKGKDKVKILDRKDFRDDPVTDYENTIKFLQQHLRLEYEIKDAGPRIEIPEIPYEALREGVLNAIIHRDYLEEGARVMVEIFDDRVEISNPGELLFGKEELGRKSVARNPVIFDMFFRLDLIEKVGSGINRIKNAVAQKGLKIEFQIDKFFTVIFHRPSDSLGSTFVRIKAQAQAQEAQVEIIDKLSESEIKILEICMNPASSKDILLKLGIKRSGSFKNSLTKLLKMELLNQTIPDSPSSPKQKYVTTELAKNIVNLDRKQ